jgi:hypothetical protein
MAAASATLCRREHEALLQHFGWMFWCAEFYLLHFFARRSKGHCLFNFEFSCFGHDFGILFKQTTQPRCRSCQTRCVVFSLCGYSCTYGNWDCSQRKKGILGYFRREFIWIPGNHLGLSCTCSIFCYFFVRHAVRLHSSAACTCANSSDGKNLQPSPRTFHFAVHFFLQFFFWATFGSFVFVQIRRLSSGADPDCFIHLGAFALCDANQLLSIYSTLFLLQAQALFSRVLVPGMSIFVNASVRRLLLAPSFIVFEYVTPRALQVLDASFDIEKDVHSKHRPVCLEYVRSSVTGAAANSSKAAMLLQLKAPDSIKSTA